MPLPVPPSVHPPLGRPDLVFRRVESGCPAPKPEGPVVSRIFCEHGDLIGVRILGPDGNWIRIPTVGHFHVAPDARHVEIYPDPGVPDQLLGLVIAGQIAIFVLYQLGFPCLHASAVTTPLGAVVFLGPKGRGKSTLAACFVRRGAALLTDDALPLRQRAGEVFAAPSLPMMKLWRETAVCALDLLEELPHLFADFEKRLLTIDGRFVYAPDPVPVRAVYLLDRYEPSSSDRHDIQAEVLRPRDAFRVLLTQTALRAFIQPAEGALVLPLYTRLVAQAPIRTLRFPTGFDHQEAVYRRIMADLEAA